MNLFSELHLMLTFEFVQMALLGGTILAILAPMIGYFMVFRGYSGISDGISHIALLGIGVSFIFSQEPTLIALIITILLSLLLEVLRSRNLLRAETSVVIFVILSLASISILSNLSLLEQSLDSLLFGSINTITRTNLYWLAAVFLFVISILSWQYKALINLVFNQETARLFKVKVDLLNYVLIAISASVIVVGIDIIGGLLMASLMIVPVASGQQYQLNFKQTHILSVVLAVLAFWLGYLSAWFLDIPPGASIAFCSLIIFSFSVVYRLLR